MKENEMITTENLEAVEKYIDKSYEKVTRIRFSKTTHASRTFESIEGFTTRMHLSIFHGEKYRHVNAYLSIWRNEGSEHKSERVCIDHTILYLDELKELESKVTELNEFVKQLGIWKV